MSFAVVKGDLLKQKYDALVIPSQPSLRLEGVIGERVKRICGDRVELELEQCKNIAISDCVITNAYNLDCKKLIHVANPKWHDGEHGEEYDLKSSYINCMELALSFKLESIAFPLLSAGAYEYPKRKAIEVAIETICDYLKDNDDLDVALVIYHEATFRANRDLFKKHEVIGGHLSKHEKEEIEVRAREMGRLVWYKPNTSTILDNGPEHKQFKEIMEYFIAQKGLSKMECYNGIISKSAFNNIMNGAIPKKYTVVALGINMGLDVSEINELLRPLGERLHDDCEKDGIIESGIYHNKDVDEINAILAADGCTLLKTSKL